MSRAATAEAPPESSARAPGRAPRPVSGHTPPVKPVSSASPRRSALDGAAARDASDSQAFDSHAFDSHASDTRASDNGASDNGDR